METAENVLNKMVDHLLSYEEIPFLDLVQYIWRREWVLGDINKPTDTDPLRLALKACLVERMVEIWNAPPKNCNETVPPWCQSVPAVKEHFSVIPGDLEVWKDEPSSHIFEKRNIFAPKEFMFFL